MHKIVFAIAVLIAVLVATALVWISRGRELAAASERAGTILIRSEPVQSLSYSGTGHDGSLRINKVTLDLAPVKTSDPIPEIGTSKDGQVAISCAGRVFNFGPPSASADDALACAPAAGDEAKLEMRRSVMAWPNPFETNFMTGNSPRWKRFSYLRLLWKKSNGANLEITQRCEQFFYRNDGWVDACMTDSGFTGLIRVEISNSSR